VSRPGPAAVGLDVVRRGAIAFAITLGAGLVLGTLGWAAGGAGSVVDAFMAGALAFLMFHHVVVEAVPAAGAAGGTGAELAVALMLGTALAGWLLFRAGRGAADRAGGRTLRTALVGASVAVPYALLAFGLAFLVRADHTALPLAGAASAAELRPDPVSALGWTLLVGLVAGVAGGLEAAPERAPEGGRLIRAAAAGGRRMAWTAVALSFVALMVLVALRPEATRAYVHDAFSSGPADGALTMATTAAVAPNAATGVLAVAAGGSIEVEVAGAVCTVLSYGRYPLGFGPGGLADACAGDFGTAPPWFILLLLVPLVAAVRGGLRAAARAGADRVRRAVAAGVWAGLAGAAAIAALMVLATVSVEAAGPSDDLVEGSASVGPDLLVSGGLMALWGALGGAAGGYLASRREVGPGEPGPTGEVARSESYLAGGGAPGGGPAAGPAGGAAVLLSWNLSQAP
jgi:hypothetical protein